MASASAANTASSALADQQQRSGSSNNGDQAEAEDDEDEAELDPGATLLDGLGPTQKYVFADEWGYTNVGADLPSGTHPSIFSSLLPPELFAFSPLRAAASVAVPLAVMAAGYGWLWYWHSICPGWQVALCGCLIGTAYAGLFKVAHECARLAFVPHAPELQNALGMLLMLPSLYSFPVWRLGTLHHMLHTNMLWKDHWGWHPLTKLELAMDLLEGRGLRVACLRAVMASPLKLLASIGHWVRHWEALDLRRFHPGSYVGVLAGWAAPALFAGLVFPAIVSAGGLSALFTYYLLPWLVFHFWLSTLSLVAHTAPHVPWRPDDGDYDAGRAVVCGTVTLRLPRPLELLLNEANYGLPQAVAPGLPLWGAREGYELLKKRLGPYLTEGGLSLKLLTNHVTKWQVYDEETDTYRPFEEVMEELETDLGQLDSELGAEMRKALEEAQAGLQAGPAAAAASASATTATELQGGGSSSSGPGLAPA
ncbi:hypothetical protein GPECTOR_41g712 [Gonium pectorale]|uniref:Fatty acid desaturase domain-containing protein n=1 Tax=Gonium pectorale TaxID=33097 RepID=A0A150GA73_GONPE|nr:hypothetical protein GPECTOR_41g712 [Gonium pectorale]|eukprot:KXZ46747.1 hypothetical protein GPECTOR_41g712 [Gonium pectorale]